MSEAEEVAINTVDFELSQPTPRHDGSDNIFDAEYGMIDCEEFDEPGTVKPASNDPSPHLAEGLDSELLATLRADLSSPRDSALSPLDEAFLAVLAELDDCTLEPMMGADVCESILETIQEEDEQFSGPSLAAGSSTVGNLRSNVPRVAAGMQQDNL